MSFQAYGWGEGFSPESSSRNGDVIHADNTENTENTKKSIKNLNTKKKYKIQNINKEKVEQERKHKRGKGKDNNKRFSILLVNLRGYRSKEYSLKKALKKIKPSMILMNEIQLRGSMKVSLEPSYISWTKNRKTQAGGGVATAVARAFMNTAGGLVKA